MRPLIRELSEQEAKNVLARNGVGRIAFSLHDRVDIRPISYVFREGWIFLRTSPGPKVEKMHHNRWIAFEVDEIRDRFDWTSVVVQGALYELNENQSPLLRRARELAIDLIRKGDPDALTQSDITPLRTEIFGISINELTGRQCGTAMGFDVFERLDQPA